jgi:LuxR family maltose regulon positive regulatory protein
VSFALTSNLTAGEIAATLCLSANTVKTDMRHLYAKLVSRTTALERARALGLLGPLGRVR